MAQPVVLKRSAVAAKVPLTTDLELGEIAVNTYDGKLYIKKDNGTEHVVKFEPKLTTNTTSIFNGPANVTTDQDLLTLTIPANYLKAGDSFRYEIWGTQSQAAVATNISAYIKINGTKQATAVVAGATTARTNRPLFAQGSVTFYTIGVSGTMITSTLLNISGILTVITAPVVTTTVNTTNAITITVGLINGTANASNLVRATNVSITQI